MAHPKRKISKTRRDKRRTHYKAENPTANYLSNNWRNTSNAQSSLGRRSFVPQGQNSIGKIIYHKLN